MLTRSVQDALGEARGHACLAFTEELGHAPAPGPTICGTGTCLVLLPISRASLCPVAAGHGSLFTMTGVLFETIYTPQPTEHSRLNPTCVSWGAELISGSQFHSTVEGCVYILPASLRAGNTNFSEDLVIQSTPMALHSPVRRPRSPGSCGAEASQKNYSHMGQKLRESEISKLFFKRGKNLGI